MSIGEADTEGSERKVTADETRSSRAMAGLWPSYEVVTLAGRGEFGGRALGGGEPTAGLGVEGRLILCTEVQERIGFLCDWKLVVDRKLKQSSESLRRPRAPKGGW